MATKKPAPHIKIMKVNIINDNEHVLTVELSDEFVTWFKREHNLKRWAPKQFSSWLYAVIGQSQ